MSIESAIQVARELQRIWGRRLINRLAIDDKVIVFDEEGSDARTLFVVDPCLSKKVLTSRHFANENYFSHAFTTGGHAGAPESALARHFEHSPMFKSGQELRKTKKQYFAVLAEVDAMLPEIAQQVRSYLLKRRLHDLSAKAAAQIMVTMAVSLVIARLTQLPYLRVRHAMRARQNLFRGYLALGAVRKTDRAISYLFAGRHTTTPTDLAADTRDQVAISLMLMGVDPLIGAIAGAIEFKIQGSAPADQVGELSPTSYVSRRCLSATQLDDVDFQVGDECFISLVATGDGSKACARSIAFGVGEHSCIGKSLALKIIALAQDLLKDESLGFSPKVALSLAPDGAFLDFSER